MQVELVPGGSSKAVSADNVVEYIHRVADYRLNYQIKAGSEAFWQGFYEVVARDWVTMFNEEEVQMLISGGGEGLDIADMQAHVNYAGGYHEQHPVIIDFWKVTPCYQTQRARIMRHTTHVFFGHTHHTCTFCKAPHIHSLAVTNRHTHVQPAAHLPHLICHSLLVVHA